MNGRALVVLAALALVRSGGAMPPAGQPPATVTVRAAVERPDPITRARQVLPWTAVSGLAREDFELRVDGEPTPVQLLSAENGPVALVVLVDVSASSPINIQALVEPIEKFLVPATQAGDRVAFGSFGGMGLRIGRRFVVDRADMQAAARTLLAPRTRRVAPAPADGGPGESVAASDRAQVTDPTIEVEGYLNGAFGLGASPAWDAVEAAVRALEAEPGRRAIVLITDGRSTGNLHSLDDVIRRAAAADVAICVVDESREDIIVQDPRRAARVRPSVFLRSLAEYSGGGYGDIFGREPTRPSVIDEGAVKQWLGLVLARLVEDLHQGYTLGFVPPVVDGQLHRLEMRVKTPGLTVRARRLYLAPSRDQ